MCEQSPVSLSLSLSLSKSWGPQCFLKCVRTIASLSLSLSLLALPSLPSRCGDCQSTPQLHGVPPSSGVPARRTGLAPQRGAKAWCPSDAPLHAANPDRHRRRREWTKGRSAPPFNAASEDRTHDLRILGPTRCQLRYRRHCALLIEARLMTNTTANLASR